MFEGFVEIGKVTGTFGTKGHIRVAFFTDYPERFAVGSQIRIQFKKIGFYIYEIEEIDSISTAGAIIKLKGIRSLTEAEDLVGRKIVILESERQKPGKDEYYPDELMHFDVKHGKRVLGEIVDIFDLAAYSLLEVKTSDGSFFVPFLKKFVSGVDKKNRTIRLSREGAELAEI